MTAPLTREQACDKFIAQKMRDGAGGLNRIISRSAFDAGWSARDAEVARLRAACEAAMSEATAIETRLVRYGSQDIHVIGNSAITIQNILRAALAGEDAK